MNQLIFIEAKKVISKYTLIESSQIHYDLPVDELKLTRFDQLELIYDLEDLFQVEFPVPIWEVPFFKQFNTVGDLVEMVDQIKKKRAA